MRPLGDRKDFLTCRYGCCMSMKHRTKQRCLKKKARQKEKIQIVRVKVLE